MIEQQIRPWNVLDASDVLETAGPWCAAKTLCPRRTAAMAFMDIEVPLLGNDAEEAALRKWPQHAASPAWKRASCKTCGF
jgi:protein-L-isoaspartate(D-aspartate) O-methyltransferase